MTAPALSLVPLAPFVQPTAAEMARAAALVDSHPVVSAYASAGWDELHDDGKVWLAALVREARRDAIGVGLLPDALPDLVDVPNEIEATIVRFVVRTYPHGGWQHEHAIRLALRLGWSARHHLTGTDQ